MTVVSFGIILGINDGWYQILHSLQEFGLPFNLLNNEILW